MYSTRLFAFPGFSRAFFRYQPSRASLPGNLHKKTRIGIFHAYPRFVTVCFARFGAEG